MAKLNVAPTKANLLSLKEQLAIRTTGYDLLEQKRELLVMELMQLLEKVKQIEKKMDKCVQKAYPSLKKMLMSVGTDRTEQIAASIQYEFSMTEKPVVISGMNFTTLDVVLPKQQLFYSFLDTFPETDEVQSDFFELLTVITQLASIRTIVWRLAMEVKKTQRRVNALDKMVIPQNKETVSYIEGVLEERERENVFVLKALKNKHKDEN